MAAYLIVEHIITDATKFEEYRTKVGPLIAKHGGRYLTKGGSHRLPEGGHWKARASRHHRVSGHGRAQRLVQRARVPALIALRKQCTSDLDMMFTLEDA